jgi:hypothetical protein
MAEIPASPVSNSNEIAAEGQDNSEEIVESQEGDEGAPVAESDIKAANPNLSPKQVKAEVKRINKLKLKVDRGEIEEELPFDLPDDPKVIEYMTKHLQMSKMGSKRASDFSALEKEVVQFVTELQQNPKKALSNPNFGLDLKKLAAEIIEEEITNSQKSPEQLEKEKYLAELEALKEERKKEKEDFEKRELERLQSSEYERYDRMMSQALEKTDLPKSPYVVKKIADYMLMGLQEGYNVEPADVIPLVREEIQREIKEMFGAMPDDVVEGFVGKDKLNSIRKKNLAKAKSAPQPVKSAVKDVGSNKTEKSDDKPKMTYKQFFKL